MNFVEIVIDYWWCIIIRQLQTRPMLSSKVNKENEANVDWLHYSMLIHDGVVRPKKYLDDFPTF